MAARKKKPAKGSIGLEIGEILLQRGEPIVIDMGCILDGYYSDMTRTIILGQADARFEEVYSLVLQAHQAAS